MARRAAPTHALKALSAALLAAVLVLFTGCATGCTSSQSPSASSLAHQTDQGQLSNTGVPAERVEGVSAVKVDAAHEADGTGEADTQESMSAVEAAAAAEKLCVRFLDVGQGDAALITCGGASLLIDGGPSAASSKLYAVLRDLDIDQLDAVIATHPDADHCGGIAGALNAASCKTFYCSVTEHDTKTFQSIQKYLGTTPITVPACGDSFSLGSAVVEFVGPVSQTRDTNNGSLVCRVTYGAVDFLFTGDAEAESESQMLASGASLDAEVLKVGHHGSASSSTKSFLEAVSPDYAVVSVGSNSYGHPTEEVLARLTDVGARILRTDELGTITFETDGDTLDLSYSKGQVK